MTEETRPIMNLLRQERLRQMQKRKDADIAALLRERESILRYVQWLETKKERVSNGQR